MYLCLVSELNTALLPVHFITLSISAEHHNCPLTLESQSYDFSILVHAYVYIWSEDCGNTSCKNEMMFNFVSLGEKVLNGSFNGTQPDDCEGESD